MKEMETYGNCICEKSVEKCDEVWCLAQMFFLFTRDKTTFFIRQSLKGSRVYDKACVAF